MKKEVARNVLVIGQGHEHPLMMSRYLRTRNVDWVTGEPILPLSCFAKTRYRQPDQACSITKDGDGYVVHFEQPQRAVTPGQSVVFYDDDRLIGGGTIMRAL